MSHQCEAATALLPVVPCGDEISRGSAVAQLFPVSHSEGLWVQVFLVPFPLENGRRGIRRLICVGLIFS